MEKFVGRGLGCVVAMTSMVMACGARTVVASSPPNREVLACSGDEEPVAVAERRSGDGDYVEYQWRCMRAEPCPRGKFRSLTKRACIDDTTIARTKEEIEVDSSSNDVTTIRAELVGTAVSLAVATRVRCRNVSANAYGKEIGRPSAWAPCGTKPIAGRELLARTDDGITLGQATTDSDGKATIELAGVKPSPALVKSHRALVISSGNVLTMASSYVDLSPLVPRWQRELDDAAAATRANAEAASAERYRDSLRTRERQITDFEKTIAAIEGKKDWGDDELTKWEICAALARLMREDAQVEREVRDAGLVERSSKFVGRVRQLQGRAERAAQMPQVKAARAARQARDEQYAANERQAQQRADEERKRQLERADDERRRQQERADDERKRQAARGEEERQRRQHKDACLQRCAARQTDCYQTRCPNAINQGCSEAIGRECREARQSCDDGCGR